MSDEQKNSTEQKADHQSKESVSLRRRQITKAGLYTPPVLMSVVSQPTFGGQARCLSNQLSGNLSDHKGSFCNLGRSPGYWKNWPEKWPPPITPDKLRGYIPEVCRKCKRRDGSWKCSGGTKFNSIFTYGMQDSDDRSMYEIICRANGSLKSKIISAYLNSLTDPDYVLNPHQVKEIWADPSMVDDMGGLEYFLNSTWGDYS